MALTTGLRCAAAFYFCLPNAAVRAATPPNNPAADFHEAFKVEQAGMTNEAFVKYLAVSGGEFAAATLGMRNPGEFLDLLSNNPAAASSPRARLVQADLLAASGRAEAARGIYHQLATNIAALGRVGVGGAYYFVEPAQENSHDSRWGFSRTRPVSPFTFGPGSHRDNWLLRRLIATDLKEDAANEFARMWDVHRGTTSTNALPTEDWVRGHPCGFSNLELQFALDYAYFLNRHGNTDKSQAVLLAALEIMDPDCKPKLPPVKPPEPPPVSNGPNKQPGIVTGLGAFQPAAFGLGMFPRASGTSQDDFCRLVYGEFKLAGRESVLIEHLERRIASGTNHTRRVLAMIRRHRGENDEALGLELEFLANAELDRLTAACRRGVVFEEYQRTTNAVAEFENALNISSSLPENERAALETYGVRDRLARFYTSQGRMEKVLEMELAQFEIHEAKADDFGQVEQLRQRFAVASPKNQFAEWARSKLVSSTRPATRANLAWQLGDFKTASKEAARAGGRRISPGFVAWLDRFEKLGPEQHQSFLTTVVESYPDDVQSWLDLLELKGELQSPSAAASYEQLLQHTNRYSWPSFYPSRLRYPKNPVETAARLVRVYERAGRFDDLRALGLKLARRQPPFAEFEQNLYFYNGENGRDEFVNATLGLAIQYADDKKYQDELAAALKTSRWDAALTQLERRMAHEAGTKKQSPTLPPVKWANLPEGVELFVSCENVRSLANDAQFVYAGQPWGIAVYDFKGQLVECVALGEPATAMAVGADGIWAATPAGLFRLRRSSVGWNIALQPGRQTRWPDGTATTHPINALALLGDELWMADRLGCRMLNVRSLEISSYSADEATKIQPQDFPLSGVDSGPLNLPDGTVVFGKGIAMDLSGHWDPKANKDESEGGLFFVSPKGVTNRVSSMPRANVLRGESVFKIVPVGNSFWLCTSLGVARMSGRLEVLECFSRRDGLFGNLVTSAVGLGGKIYFGCAWDWRGGGLVEFDPATEVFTSYVTADGMDANRIEDLGATLGGKLKVVYAGETWMNENPNYRLCPPGKFDPKTRRFESGGPPKPVSQTDAWRMRFEWDKRTPFLGGPLLRKIQLGGKTFYCGTRGMAVVRGGQSPREFAKLGAVEIPSFDDRMRAAADAFDLQGWTSPEGVLRGLDHTNRYIRARIICALYKQSGESLNACIPALDKALDDPFERVRDNAVQLIIKTQGSQALSALRHGLENSKLEIRVLAACELAKRGEVPPLNILEDWLKKGDGHVPISQGYDIFNILQVSTPASKALAQMGTKGAAALCLKYPAAISHTGYRPGLVAAWGESIREHPETADVWLSARGRDPKTRWPLPPLAKEVLQSAGKDLLPKLHQALTSTNRVIRTNAAGACGAIGDPSSIPHLLAALDLESGLARASIVWALGELKATNAVPQLYALYTETSSRPSRPASRVGFLASQSGDSYSAQYAALQDKDSIAREWQALTSSEPSQAPDDADGDELLSVDRVLEAIRKIGPGEAQEFYRKLAGSARGQDRLEAASQLGNGGPADMATNRPILLSLRSDPDANVRVAAAITLLLLGEPKMDADLCARLRVPDDGARALVLDHLKRVPDRQLEFARKEIEAIASDYHLPLYLTSKAGALLPKLKPKSP